jgi:hypothetical protein
MLNLCIKARRRHTGRVKQGRRIRTAECRRLVASGSRRHGIGFSPTLRPLISFDKSALLSQSTISRGIRPEGVAGADAAELRGRMPQWAPPHRRLAPWAFLGSVPSCAFNRFAAICAELAISRSSADQGLGTTQFPSIDS